MLIEARPVYVLTAPSGLQLPIAGKRDKVWNILLGGMTGRQRRAGELRWRGDERLLLLRTGLIGRVL